MTSNDTENSAFCTLIFLLDCCIYMLPQLHIINKQSVVMRDMHIGLREGHLHIIQEGA